MENKKKIQWLRKLINTGNKRTLLFWMTCNVALCILPSVVLILNREILATISTFLDTRVGTFYDVLPYILTYGMVLAISGISSRINTSFLYFRMYDSYYLGMQEIMMDFFQEMPQELLFRKEVKDEYNAIIRRVGSLTDVTSAICDLMGKGCGVIALIITAGNVSYVISFFIAAYFVVMLYFNYRMTTKLKEVEKKLAPAERRLSYITEMPLEPNVAKEIRVYENQDQMMKQWSEFYEKTEEADNLYNKSTGRAGILSCLFLYLFMGLILLYCLKNVYTGIVSIEDFLMIFTLCGSLATYVTQISSAFIILHRGLFALERQRKFMTMVEEEKVRLSAHIEVKQRETDEIYNVNEGAYSIIGAKELNFCYQSNKIALHNINISIPAGQIVALVGENGSGKSTLVKVLIGMYRPINGIVWCHGTISTFFQDFYIFHKTVRENIGMGNINYIEERTMVNEAIYKSGAAELISSFPKGMDTLLRKEVFPDGIELSGGERQKIGIARAYMGEHDILIFDEPASALDPIAELEQFKKIRQNLKGSTAILISHRIGFAQLADRIIVIDNGEICEDGKHDDLLAQNGLYAKMFRLQAKWYDKEACFGDEQKDEFS